MAFNVILRRNGNGLVFWSIAEPLTHYVYPDKISGFTEEAKMFALKKVFLHWGTSAWGCYAILALILAYMQFRKKKPALMSSALIPIIGEERAKGTLGNIVDIFTIFCNSGRNYYIIRTWYSTD